MEFIIFCCNFKVIFSMVVVYFYEGDYVVVDNCYKDFFEYVEYVG